jgi:hypothetical protein
MHTNPVGGIWPEEKVATCCGSDRRWGAEADVARAWVGGKLGVGEGVGVGEEPEEWKHPRCCRCENLVSPKIWTAQIIVMAAVTSACRSKPFLDRPIRWRLHKSSLLEEFSQFSFMISWFSKGRKGTPWIFGAVRQDSERCWGLLRRTGQTDRRGHAVEVVARYPKDRKETEEYLE